MEGVQRVRVAEEDVPDRVRRQMIRLCSQKKKTKEKIAD